MKTLTPSVSDRSKSPKWERRCLELRLEIERHRKLYGWLFEPSAAAPRRFHRDPAAAPV